VFVDDGHKSLLSDKGSGIQSAFIVNLFCYYCSKFHNNGSLLAIEEPELYLHPQGRRVLLHVFEEFIKKCDGGIEGNQVIITTHSSDFIKGQYVPHIIVVRQEANETKAYKLRDINQDQAKQLQVIEWKHNLELFFADKILIVEGAEHLLIPVITNKVISEAYLDQNNITVIRAGGKDNIKKYVELAKQFNITWHVLADLDYLFKGVEELLPIITYDATMLSEIRRQATKILSENGEWDTGHIEKRLTGGLTIDSKSFCELMERFEQGENITAELLKLWKYLKPQIKKKVDLELLTANQELYDLVKMLIADLKNKNVFILQKGELEDYLTSEGILLDSSKERRIHRIVNKVVIENKELEAYIDTSELNEFVRRYLEQTTH